MEEWFEKFEFIKDPYERLDPTKISLNQMEWNRYDLNEDREKLNQFVEDAVTGKRTSLKIFGPLRSGKTWLSHILFKEIYEKFGSKDDVAFIYTKIPKRFL
ncbi:MAG: hypothetical protein IIC67_06730 [Thaumarchaeota archaeon]|nr:hypothetical protein [Nitrososphaerota archaeon]